MDPKQHNCMVAAAVENDLFHLYKVNETPDELCPICKQPLRGFDVNQCCQGYAKRLKCDAGHFVHVICQIRNNPRMLFCPVCQQQLASYFYYAYIIKKKIIFSLPVEMRAALLTASSITNRQKIGFLKQYGISFDVIVQLLSNVFSAENDCELLSKFFDEYLPL